MVQHSTERHRVARVDREIEDHLLELIGVHADVAGVNVECESNVDVRAEDSFEHFARSTGSTVTGLKTTSSGIAGASDGLELRRQHRGA